MKNETIVALSTAQGEGAIAVIRLSGDEAITLVNQSFVGHDLTTVNARTAVFGTIQEKGELLDEVLVTLFRAPHSYTGEDVVEISCHASPFIVEQLISMFTALGAALAKPGEFTQRAYLNGKLNLSQAEAVADLIVSESAATHRMAMSQMRGGYAKELSSLRERLLHFASLITLELDFAEEDVEFANRNELNILLDDIEHTLTRLIGSFQYGNAMKKGIPVVIAGKPNAGKSTLLNALLGEEKALVTEIAGTTRDSIEDVMTIEGVPFRFIDTAGLRDTEDVVEALGVERAREKLSQASIVLYLFDHTTTSIDELEAMVNELKPTLHEDAELLVVANKCDKANARLPKEGIHAKISAATGEGVADLKLQLLQAQERINKGYSAHLAVANQRHVEALRRTLEAVEATKEGLSLDISGDLLSIDIKQALHHLGSITGEVTTDDILGNIFSKFCIGK